MLVYSLFLDESGNFKEQSKTARPSMVAGYLVRERSVDDVWATNALARIKNAHRDEYEGISIHPYHAMEDAKENVPHVADFATELLTYFVKDPVRMVRFDNQKGIVIVDSDTTYLNVFTNGVLS